MVTLTQACWNLGWRVSWGLNLKRVQRENCLSFSEYRLTLYFAYWINSAGHDFVDTVHSERQMWNYKCKISLSNCYFIVPLINLCQHSGFLQFSSCPLNVARPWQWLDLVAETLIFNIKLQNNACLIVVLQLRWNVIVSMSFLSNALLTMNPGSVNISQFPLWSQNMGQPVCALSRLGVSALHIIPRQVYEVRFGICQEAGDIFMAYIIAAVFWTWNARL